ncbi:unnamed protein product [Prorocentrum cordatum]|uniref:Alpha-1,4-N-acetylglucosaminyltransferase n=1 Tax=Prorocentrum cordatum TaxID=2364126 RepID=A0ABN9S3K9_9DINO|nr:unnamed protein product [Polarella glacialis]
MHALWLLAAAAASRALRCTAQPGPAAAAPGPSTRRIPDRLLFNHRVNLLKRPKRDRDRAANVRRTIGLVHGVSEVQFLDDDECSTLIASTHSQRLASYFDEEPIGMYKSDICRLAQLAAGGYYLDTDLEVLRDFRTTLPEEVDFVSVIAFQWIGPKNPNEMYNAFIGAAAGHPVVRRAMDMCLEYYDGRNRTLVTALGEHMRGTMLMRMAYEEWAGEEMASGPQVRPPSGLSYFWDEERLNQDVYPDVVPQEGEGTNCNVAVVDRSQQVALFFSHSVGRTTSCRPRGSGISASRSSAEL